MIELYILIWITCGVINYGFMVGFFQSKWPSLAYDDRITDRVFAAVASMGGPIALLIIAFIVDFREWRL